VNRKPLSIVVVGGRHISPEACEIAYAIGRSVVERGHILMTGGTSGSDECAARGAFEYLQGTGRDPKRHIISYRPQRSPRPHFPYGQVLVAGKKHYQRREQLVQAGDVIVLIAGGKGTAHIFDCAIQQHKPVLPVGQTGGTAAQKWEAFSIALDYHYKGKISPLEFRQLYPGQNQPESIADWVVRLAERLVPNPEASTQHESQQSRQISQDALTIRDTLRLNQTDQIAATIQASLAKGLPRLFDTGGLCAGYPLEPSPDEYFVAHEFSEEKIGDLRHALAHGLAGAHLKPYTADQDIRPGHILCKIAAKIQTTAFCIFDLPESQNRNVYLELGIAIGLGRPFVLVKSARAQVPSLVEGLDYFGFTSYTGLRQEVGERIQVGQFSAILPREDVPTADTYFVADGEFEQEDFRQAIRDTLQSYALQPVYLAEGQVGPELALSQLIRNIQVARFGIYRIDEEASANTFLALGLAIGLNKPWLLVAREGATIPVDVRGLSNFNFRSFMQLEKELADRCREFLQRYVGDIKPEQEQRKEEPPPTYLPKEQEASVLVIGHTLDVDVECVEWDSSEPNVADYDVVIMDLTTAHAIQLPPPGAYSVQARFQVNMSKYLQWPNIQLFVEKLLRSGGRLFVIARPEIAVHPHSPRREVYESRSSGLLPFVFWGDQVSGQSVTWIDSRFNFYFQQVGEWNFVLSGQFLENFAEQVPFQVYPLAKNRAGEMIALSVSVQGAGLKMPGVIYLLPPPTKIPSSEAIKLILEHLDDLEEIPQWYEGLAQERQEQVSSSTGPGDIAGKTVLQQKPVPQEQPMAGIPPNMHKQLREALLDCGPFGDDNQLRAVFAHPKLRPWRHSVPQASNPADRVDATIAFLVEKRRADTKENALVLLLQVLSERFDPADECHPRLAKLAENLERARSSGSPASPTGLSMDAASTQPFVPDAEIIAEIEGLVREDQLAEALEKLSGLETYRHEATLLAQRLKRIRERERRGTVTRDDADAEYTRIAKAILDLISS